MRTLYSLLAFASVIVPLSTPVSVLKVSSVRGATPEFPFTDICQPVAIRVELGVRVNVTLTTGRTRVGSYDPTLDVSEVLFMRLGVLPPISFFSPDTEPARFM